MKNSVARNVNLKSSFKKLYADDAGTMTYETKPADLWQLRYKVGKMLSSLKPAYKESWFDLQIPGTGAQFTPELGYVSVAPPLEPRKPDCDTFK